MDKQREEFVKWAILFHETYERLAPKFGYETRKEYRDFDSSSNNGQLMIAVCSEVIPAAQAAMRPEIDEVVQGRRNAIALNLRYASDIAELNRKLTDCQAKLDAATKIISAAKDFDAASEDAEWEPPHPIFMMAQENDDLRAKLKRYEDAFKEPYAWESDNQGDDSFITKERHDALSCSSNGILKELFTKPEGE
jgi:hypothetical protein